MHLNKSGGHFLGGKKPLQACPPGAPNFYLLKYFNILVITDDISLPLGSLRMKRKGSDGGHNGLKDINNILGTSDYPRLRFGIGSNFQKGKQADYVLSEFTEKENLFLEEKVELALKMIQGFTTVGIEETMQKFNRK